MGGQYIFSPMILIMLPPCEVAIIIYTNYTEHCSVGPTNFIETIGTARLKIRDYRYGAAEDFGTARLKISKFRFLNLDF